MNGFSKVIRERKVRKVLAGTRSIHFEVPVANRRVPEVTFRRDDFGAGGVNKRLKKTVIKVSTHTACW